VHAASKAATLPPQAACQLEQLACVGSALVGRERLKGAGSTVLRALRCWGGGAHRVAAYWGCLARLLADLGLVASSAQPPVDGGHF
jgi:hypothetical protein